MIYNADDEVVSRMVENASSPVRKIPFGKELRRGDGAALEAGKLVTFLDARRNEIVRVEEMSLRGMHNAYNAMAATLAAELVGVRPASLRATLRNFKGVEHRLEFVRELDDFDADKPYEFDLRIMASENRLDLPLTVLDPKKGT